MFEGLLERLLLSYFGKFIDGVDKNRISLGVISGNLIIEDVSIKREAIDELELPIKITYSSIQRLQLIVPWRTLSSQRVEIKIQNVFILVSAKDVNDWNLKELNNYSKKMESIEQWVKKFLEDQQRNKTLMKQQSQEKNSKDNSSEPDSIQKKYISSGTEKAGYLEKMISRIIDNIYIEISNVHFRYEHDIILHRFSWGFTIHKVVQETLDNSWEPTKALYDRHDPKQRNKPINKKITLEKFALYWNSDDNTMLSNQSKQVIFGKMNHDIFFEPEILNTNLVNSKINFPIGQQEQKSSKYIFCLNATAKVIQNLHHNFQTSEYKVEVEFNQMHLKIKHTQVKEIIQLMEFFNDYQCELKYEKDLYKIPISKPDFSKLKIKEDEIINPIEKKEFIQSIWVYIINSTKKEVMRKRYIEYYLKSLYQKNTFWKILPRRDFSYFTSIVKQNTIEDLQQWTKTAMEIKDRTNNLKVDNKWKFWKQKQYSAELEEDRKLRELIKQELYLQQQNAVPETYAWLEFNLNIKEGSLKLSHRMKGIEEGFIVSWKGFKLQQKKRQNNFEIDLIIFHLETQMFSLEAKNDVCIPIMRKISSYDYSEKPLFQFHYEKHPLAKPHYFSSISLEFESIEILLYIGALKRILGYFRVTQNDDKIQQRIDLAESGKQVIQEKLEETIVQSQRHELKIKIFSPQFIIPSKQINDYDSECWVFKLGDLDLITVDQSSYPQQQTNQAYNGQPPVTPQTQGYMGSNNRQRGSTTNQNAFLFNELQINQLQQPEFPPIIQISQPQQKSPARQANRFQRLNSQEDVRTPGQALMRNINSILPRQGNERSSKFYDRFILKLERVQLQYFSSLNYFYTYLKFHKSAKAQEILNHPLRSNSTKIDVIKEFSIQVQIYLAKENQLVTQGKVKPQKKIRFVLPMLSIILTPTITQSLQRLSQTLSQKDTTLSNILQQEKEKLFKYSTMKGYLRKRGTFFRSWTIYFVVLSGWYLYFYLSEKDNDYDSYISLRNVKVDQCHGDIGVSHSFKIMSARTVTYLQCKNPNEMKKWIKYIQQRVHDINQNILPNNLQYLSNDKNQFQQPPGLISGKLLSEFEKAQEVGDQVIESQQLIFLDMKAKFKIEKIEVFFKDDKDLQHWMKVQVDTVFLKLYQVKMDSYCLFMINSIEMVESDYTVFKSLSLRKNTKHQKLNRPNQEKKGFSISRKFKRMKKIQQRKKFTSQKAIKIQIFQAELTRPGYTTAQIDILILLSDFEINYRKSFLEKLNKLMESKDETKIEFTDDHFNKSLQKMRKNQEPNQSSNETAHQLFFINVPAGDGKQSLQSQQSNQRQEDDIEEESIHSNYESYINISLITKDIRIEVITKKNKKLLEVSIKKLFGMISMGEDSITIKGDISRLTLIDLITLRQNHLLFGCSLEKNVIFESLHGDILNTNFQHENLAYDSMVIFNITNFFPSSNIAKINDHVYFNLHLTIAYCYIDYLHASSANFLKYFEEEYPDLNIPQQKQDIFEIQNDYEQLAMTIVQPKLAKIQINWFQPIILLKPLTSSPASIILKSKSIKLEIKNQKEKNRISEKQQRKSNLMDAIWCQNITIQTDQMEINIKQDNLAPISNKFSIFFRLQTPLFINEYEKLFPNLILDKNKEIRVIITPIEIVLFRRDFLFLIETIKSNFSKKGRKMRNKEQMEHELEIIQTRDQYSDTDSSDTQQQQQVVVGFNIFSFLIRKFEITLMGQIEKQKRHFQPLLHFSFQEVFTRVVMREDENKESVNEILFGIGKIQSYQFDYFENNGQLKVIKKGIINQLSNQTMEIDELEKKIQIDEYDELKQGFYDQTKPDPSKNQFFIEGVLSNDTILKIQLVEQKVLVNFSYFEIINNFFAMDTQDEKEKIPTKPKYSKQTSSNKPFPFTSTKVTLIIDRSLILFHGYALRNVLTIQGAISINYEKLYNDESLHQMYHKNQGSDFIPRLRIGQATHIRLKIIDFQVYSAFLEQIIGLQLKNDIGFKSLRKRQIIEPCNLEYISEIFQCDCVENTITTVNEETIQLIKKIRLRMSYHDFNLVMDIMTYQNDLLEDIKEITLDDIGIHDIHNEHDINDEANIGKDCDGPQKPQNSFDIQLKSAIQYSSNSYKQQNTIINQIERKLIDNSILQKNKNDDDAEVQSFNQQVQLQASVILEVPSQNSSVQQVFQVINDSKPEINNQYLSRKSLILEKNAIEIVLINDLSKSYVPLVVMNLGFDNFIWENNLISSLLQAIVNLKISYYNPIAGLLEPIFEETDFILNSIMNYKGYPEIYLTIQKTQKESSEDFKSALININLSTEMLLIFYRTMQLWKKKFEEHQLQRTHFQSTDSQKIQSGAQTIQHSSTMNNQLHHSAIQSLRKLHLISVLNSNQLQDKLMEKVTLFTVSNQTGYQIKIIRLKSHNQEFDQLEIPIGEIKNYMVESHGEDYAKTFEKEQKFQLQFIDAIKFKLYTIDNLQINEVGTKKYFWDNSKSKYFSCTIQMKSINKTVIISSMYVLHNITDTSIIVQLNNQDHSHDYFIEPQTITAIPNDFVFDTTTIQIKFNDKKTLRKSENSQPINFMQTIKKVRKHEFTPISHSPFNTIVRNILTNEVNILTFHPIAVVKNCLPVPLEIKFDSSSNPDFQQQQLQFYSSIDQYDIFILKQSSLHISLKNQNSINDQDSILQSSEQLLLQQDRSADFFINSQTNVIIIQPQGEYFINNLTFEETLGAQIQIQGFKVSKRFVLYQNDIAEDDFINSINLDGVLVKIKRELLPCQYYFYFYIETCIINTTPFKLLYYTLKANKINKLVGQDQSELRHSRLSNEIYDKILICQPQKYIMVATQESPNDISNEISLSVLGSSFIQLKRFNVETNKYQLYEFGLHITMSGAVTKFGLFTKVIEVMPKYVIINSSLKTLHICQEDSINNEIKLLPAQREAFVWPDCRNEQLKSILITCQEDQKMNWSGSLFISEIRTAHFFCIPQVTPIHQIQSGKSNQSSFFEKTFRFNDNKKNSSSTRFDQDTFEKHKQSQPSQNNSEKSNEKDEFNKNSVFFNAEIQKIKSTFFVIIDNANEETYAYKLQNECPSVKIYYSQNGIKNAQEWVLPYKSICPFAWEQPSRNQQLKLRFVMRNLQEKVEILDLQKHSQIQIFSLKFQENIGSNRLLESIRLSDSQINSEKIIKIRVEIVFSGATKYVIFSDGSEDVFKSSGFISQRKANKQKRLKNTQFFEKETDIITKVLILYIDSLGISLMMRNQQKIIEANYIYFKKIEMGMTEKLNHRTFQLRIKFFNIDNNTSYNTITPVIMTPNKCDNLRKNKNQYFLDLSFQINHKAESVTIIDFIRVSLCPVTITLDEEYTDAIVEGIKEFISEFEDKFEDDSDLRSVLPIRSLIFISPQKRVFSIMFCNYFQDLIIKRILKIHKNPSFFVWDSIQISRSKKLLYIRSIILPPINFVFSFHKRITHSNSSFYVLITALGTAIQNINEAPIRLLGIQMSNVYDSIEIVVQTLVEHYKSEMLSSLINIIGSIEIIGNPVGLIQRISAGVIDFVEMPIEGLRDGPLDFGIGLVQGTGSLIKNTVAGAFYSVNKLTGSISSGVSMLSLDEKYLEKRRIFMLKPPKHIGEGLVQGCQSIYMGFKEGITGLVIQPYEGTMREGMKGLIKGTAKGITGLIIKPVTGILDASAKTAESVTNTATIFDDKPNDQRIRVPRIFYETTRYFKKYKDQDSRVVWNLQNFNQGKYSQVDFLRCFADKKDQDKFLILSYQWIFIKNKEIVLQEIETNQITKIELKENNVFLTLVNNNQVKLEIQIEKIANLVHKLNKIKDHT